MLLGILLLLSYMCSGPRALPRVVVLVSLLGATAYFLGLHVEDELRSRRTGTGDAQVHDGS